MVYHAGYRDFANVLRALVLHDLVVTRLIHRLKIEEVSPRLCVEVINMNTNIIV